MNLRFLTELLKPLKRLKKKGNVVITVKELEDRAESLKKLVASNDQSDVDLKKTKTKLRNTRSQIKRLKMKNQGASASPEADWSSNGNGVSQKKMKKRGRKNKSHGLNGNGEHSKHGEGENIVLSKTLFDKIIKMLGVQKTEALIIERLSEAIGPQ